MSVRVVVVGSGIAAYHAVEAIARAGGHEITVVSEESRTLIARTALYYVVAGQLHEKDLWPFGPDAFAALGARVVVDRAVAIDPVARTLVLRKTERVPYDRLLLCCGSRPRAAPWPGATAPGVGALVTRADLAWLGRELLGKAVIDERDLESPDGAPSPYTRRAVAAETHRHTAENVVVIGGGLIGVEAVEAAVALKKRVTFLVREGHYFPPTLARGEAEWIAERMRAHGVDVRFDVDIEGIEARPSGTVAAVVTRSGAIAADAVVVAIGVVPATEWLASSGIALSPQGGVVVDDALASSLPDVYAAGDCAAVPDGNGGHRVRQLWYTARDQGRALGAVVTGAAARYAAAPFSNAAKLFDVELTTAGAMSPAAMSAGPLVPAGDWFFAEHGRVRSTLRISSSDGVVTGVQALGRRYDHAVWLRFIAERRSPAHVIERIRESAFDSELVPPLVVPRALWP